MPTKKTPDQDYYIIDIKNNKTKLRLNRKMDEMPEEIKKYAKTHKEDVQNFVAMTDIEMEHYFELIKHEFTLSVEKQQISGLWVQCDHRDAIKLTIPKGYSFIYHIRSSEDDDFLPITIEPNVIIDHWGVVITKNEIIFPEGRPAYFELESSNQDEIQDRCFNIYDFLFFIKKT